MKLINFKTLLLIVAGITWANQTMARKIELPGTLKSASTTTSGASGTRKDSYTCTESTSVCVTITIPDGDSSSLKFPYLPKDIIEDGQIITISAKDIRDVTGRFVGYTNEPTPNEAMTTRTHKFEIIE